MSTSCTQCPAGHSCEDPANFPAVCAEGEYSEAGWAQCRPCPAGYSCADRVSTTACTNSAGSAEYSLAGEALCTMCPAGSECSDPSWTPLPCGEGEYSLPGAKVCTICTAGHKCPTPDTYPIKCQLGQYQVETGKSFCRPCPPGSTCANAAQEPQACANGGNGEIKVTDIASQTCKACPAGYACP